MHNRIVEAWIGRTLALTLLGAGMLGLSGCGGVEQTMDAPEPAGVEMGAPETASDAAAADAAGDTDAEGEAAADAGAAMDAEAHVLGDAQLGNASYTIDDTVVALVDGIYQEKPMPDSASFIANYSLGPWRAYGDLNGDGVEDAAQVLINMPGGSGVFMFLAAVADEAGQASVLDTISLGDRQALENLSIADGKVFVTGKTHGPDDPMCCPTLEFSATYGLQDGKLVLESEDGMGTEGAMRPATLVVDSGSWLGTTCAFAGEGATLAFDDKRVSYTCEPADEVEGDVVLLGEPSDNGDGTWTAELGVIDRNAADDGFALTSTEMVMASTAD
ncbi:MAG: hypothetical protein H6648_01595 [Caldilineae bacterium]|nr:hypothetical protein [Caldilineae bacterium]